MTFLAPSLLFLGAAVAVPLIVHLFRRGRAPRIVFPAVRYLRRAEQGHATRIRIRQLLLLTLRVLAILLLTGAAARPFLAGAGGAHAATDVALIVDNSMSSGAVVGDRQLLDRLKAGARETLAQAGPDDRFWLVRAGEPWEPALAGDAAAIHSAVEALAPSSGAARLFDALTRARSILEAAGEGRAREIHLLSDLQASGLGDGDPGDTWEIPVRVLAPEPEVANRAVVEIEIGGGIPPRAGERSSVAATVSASGPVPAGSVDVRLVMDGRTRAAVSVPIGAGAVLPLPARPPGPITGRVEIDRDALAADDRRYFAVDVAQPRAVALLRPTPFLDETVDVLAGAGRVRRADAATAELLFSPAARGAEALRRDRTVVVLPPASAVELAATNSRLGDAGVPWRLTPHGAGEARIDTAGLDLDALGTVRLRQVYGLRRTGDGGGAMDSVLVRLRTGEPWAVAGRAGADGGRYILLGTPLTAEASGLPTSAAMLPLIDRIVNVWGARALPAEEHVPGDVVRLPVGDSVVGPDGVVEPVPSGQYRLTASGLYRVMSADRLIGARAVNSPRWESDLTPLTTDQLTARIPTVDLRVAGADRWADVIYHRRLGRGITVPLIVLGLVVLLVESAVAATGRPA